MPVDTLASMRELDHRHNDGIHVRLLWSEPDNRVAVAVADAKTGEAFVVEVRNGDSALDVFHHPYAYAAWRRVDTRGDASLAGVALASA
jgi:enolase